MSQPSTQPSPATTAKPTPTPRQRLRCETPGDPTSGTDRLMLVHDGDHLVRVRWRWTPRGRDERGHGRPLWRCSTHGPQATTDCVHAYSAAIYLAEQLLGLSSVSTDTRTERNHL